MQNNKYLISLFFLFLSFISTGQKTTLEESKTYPPLISNFQTGPLKDIDMLLNTQMAFSNYLVDSELMKSNFTVNNLRFEIKGKIHDKVYFRFRNRYSKVPDPNTIDNISRTVDLAHIIIDVNSQSKLTIGKMIGDWGGYELLMNPIENLAFNNIIEKSDIFLVGAAYTYSIPDSKSKFNVQLLNSRTKTFEEQYGINVPPNINETETPFVFVGNWKNSFFKGKLETSYSYCFNIDAEDTYRNYFTLGNKFKNHKFTLYYDFHYSLEDLDNKGIVSKSIKKQEMYAAQDVTYIENWLRAEYRIKQKVNLLLTIMNHNAYWNGNSELNKNNKFLYSYGFIPTIEYSPFEDLNLKFFIGYVGRKYNYSAFAESTYNAMDYSTGQLSIGIISPLLIL